MPTATITSKSQVTLPKRVREALKVQTGDKIDFIIATDGTVTVRPATHDVMSLYGLLHREGQRPISIEEMNEGIAAAIVEKYQRSRR
jgi:antitoxin PrlF